MGTVVTVVIWILFAFGCWSILRFWFYAAAGGMDRNSGPPAVNVFDALLPLLFFIAAFVAKLLFG